MSVATAASRGIGFGRVWVVAAVLGTTYLGNTYQSSNSVSNILFELVAAGVLSAVLVPTFAEHFRQDDQAEAERLASGVLGFALVVMGVVAVVGMIFAPAIAGLLSAGELEPRHRAAAGGAVHVPAAVHDPAGPALRGGHRRHRGAVRAAALRDHRDRTDRQHRRHRDRDAGVPGDARRQPQPRSHPRREARARHRRHAGRDRLHRRAVRRGAALRVPAAAEGRRNGPQAAPPARAVRVGRAATRRRRPARSPRWSWATRWRVA